MGGRGTYSKGIDVPFTFKCVGYIEGVKVLQPINTKNRKLPGDSHSSESYILLDRNGVFKQMRIYNADLTWKKDIDFGGEHDLTEHYQKVLHIHEFDENGKRTDARYPTTEERKKYDKYFVGLGKADRTRI